MRRTIIAAGLGLVLVPGLSLASAPPASNGFETPVTPAVTGRLLVDPTGTLGSDLTFVSSGDVQLWHKKRIKPAEGKQSLDLNGTQPGRVCGEYDIPVPGATYRILFRYAGDPRGFAVPVKTFDLVHSVDGSDTDVKPFAFNTIWFNRHNLVWKHGFYEFSGLIGEQTFCFDSTTPGRNGPMIDDLRYVQVSP